MSQNTPSEKEFSIRLKKRVSECLKRVMFEFNISNKDLSEKTGFDSTYISHLRNGKRLPNFENFMKLLEALSDDAQDYFLQMLFQKKKCLKVGEKCNKYHV